MYNGMNTIYPRPYPQRNSGSYAAGNNSADKDGHNQQGQERQNQQENRNNRTIASGRASQVATQSPSQNIPQRVSYPQGMYSSAQPHPQVSGQIYPMNTAQYRNISPQQTQISSAQTGVMGAKNNRVNIAQILRDFRNTMKAISTPAEVENNVNNYLKIVEQQVVLPNPQVPIIQSNLKIAASLLDKYISETLNKDSKVVQNWLEALFLQRINYNYNEEEINPNFLVKFDENKTPQNNQQPQPSQSVEVAKNDVPLPPSDNILQNDDVEIISEEEYKVTQQKIAKRPNITIVPQDTRLKSLFIEAKKQAFSNNPQKAMKIFKEAFTRAGELKDNETQSRICLEIGKIYDDNNFVVQALTSYYKSLQYTTDTNVKSKAHYSMAQIYDDANQVESALEHYMTSISYAGKGDDVLSQTESLTKMANIFTDKYDDNNAFEYYNVARKLIEQTDDSNMKGYVLSNTAEACVQFKKNDRALKYYAEAVKNYEDINALEEIAENYKSAAEIMISYNNLNKAKSLLKKALVNATKTLNEDLCAEINLLLASISE